MLQNKNVQKTFKNVAETSSQLSMTVAPALQLIAFHHLNLAIKMSKFVGLTFLFYLRFFAVCWLLLRFSSSAVQFQPYDLFVLQNGQLGSRCTIKTTLSKMKSLPSSMREVSVLLIVPNVVVCIQYAVL